mgnify:CR=1 FL=1
MGIVLVGVDAGIRNCVKKTCFIIDTGGSDLAGPVGLGAATVLILFIIYLKFKSSTPKDPRKKSSADHWQGAILPVVQGKHYGVRVRFENLPVQINIKNGKKRFFGEQGHEFFLFLQDTFSKDEIHNALAAGSVQYRVNCASTVPYTVKFEFSREFAAEMKKARGAKDFFWEMLADAIVEAYSSEKIK